MRLVAQHDISKLFQEKNENIIKDYSESYGLKPNISVEKSNGTSSIKPNITVNVNNPNVPNNNTQMVNNISNNLQNMNINETRVSTINEINTNNLDLQGKHKLKKIKHNLTYRKRKHK